MARRKASFFGSSAILLTSSFSSRAFRIFANSRCFLRRRASTSSSESERSKSVPRLRRKPPLLMSLKIRSTAFSSLARSPSLHYVSKSVLTLADFRDLRIKGRHLSFVDFDIFLINHLSNIFVLLTSTLVVTGSSETCILIF